MRTAFAVAPSPCPCTAFKIPSLIDTVGACWRPRALRSPPAAGAVLAGRALLRFSVASAFPPNRVRMRSAISSSLSLSVRRMAVGRIALVGDAAFIPRPHTAASTAKAAGNALALVDTLKRETDIPAALRAWEPDQIQYGLHLRRQGKLLGDQSQKRYPEPRPT